MNLNNISFKIHLFCDTYMIHVSFDDVERKRRSQKFIKGVFFDGKNFEEGDFQVYSSKP